MACKMNHNIVHPASRSSGFAQALPAGSEKFLLYYGINIYNIVYNAYMAALSVKYIKSYANVIVRAEIGPG